MKIKSRLFLPLVVITLMIGLGFPLPAGAATPPLPDEAEVDWNVTIKSSYSWSSENENDEGEVINRENGDDSFSMQVKGTTKLQRTWVDYDGHIYLSPRSEEKDYSLSCQGGGSSDFWETYTLTDWDPITGWGEPTDFEGTLAVTWQYSTPGNRHDIDPEDDAVYRIEIIPPESDNEPVRYKMMFEPFFFIQYDTLSDYIDVSGESQSTYQNFDGSHSESEKLEYPGAYGAPGVAEQVWYDRIETHPAGGFIEGELEYSGDKFKDSGSVHHTFIDGNNGWAEIIINYEINRKPTIKYIQPNQALGRYEYWDEDNFNPATDFVAGKETAVQVFFEKEIPVASVNDVTVEVSRDGSTVATLTSFKRDTENNCLIFMPRSRSQCGNWAAGVYKFTAKIDDVEETLEDVEFKASRKLNVLAVPVKANYAGDIKTPGNQWRNGGDFMRRVYPVAYNNFSYKQRTIFNASDPSYDITTDAGQYKLWEGLNELQKNGAYDLIIGFIEDGITLPGNRVLQGYTYGAPSNIVVNSDQDMQATVAHEVAHIYGVGDEYQDGTYNLSVNSPPLGYQGDGWDNPDVTVTATDPDVKPFPGAEGSLISEKLHPLDTGGRGLLEDSISFMGSGASQSKNWISVDVWQHLFDALTTSAEASTLSMAPSVAAGETRVIEASGWVSGTGQVELSLPWTSYTTTETVAINTGTYTIQAVDDEGNVLAGQGFTPSFYVRSNPPRAIDPAPFVRVIVPFPDGTKKFQVVDQNDSVLQEVNVTSGVPTITVDAPAAGQEVSGVTTITWTVGDPDEDSLQYKVEYSPDGINWNMLAFRLTDNRWVQDFSELPGGDRAQIRVTASDGVNSTTAESGEFTVPFKGPDVFIETPESGSSYTDGVVLSGSAYDPQEGQIYDDNRLIWSSDRAGELGRGPTVFATNLAGGSHVVTLMATNSTGQSNSQSVTVNITDSPPVVEPGPATEFQAQTGIDPDKEWKVVFNQPVDANSLQGQVMVLDLGNNPVAAQVVPGGDGRSAIIYPPAGGYLSGQTYMIYVTNGIQSASGETLKCNYKMYFTIITCL